MYKRQGTPVEDAPLAVDKFTSCVTDVDAWLSADRLRLNEAITPLLWLGSSQLVDMIDCRDALVLDTSVAFMESADDLGVMIDHELSFRLQSATSTPTTANSQFVVSTVHATKTLVQAFISCRLDYCNSLLYGINDGLFAACSQCKTLPLS